MHQKVVGTIPCRGVYGRKPVSVSPPPHPTPAPHRSSLVRPFPERRVYWPEASPVFLLRQVSHGLLNTENQTKITVTAKLGKSFCFPSSNRI